LAFLINGQRIQKIGNTKLKGKCPRGRYLKMEMTGKDVIQKERTWEGNDEEELGC
jgi:hypothetical protein